MNDYDSVLKAQFSELKIMLVRHDTSPTGMPCYIEAHLGKTPKDKGALVLDLGNYIYRTTGISYQNTPEFRGRGKNCTIRWFMSWDDLRPLLQNIYKTVKPEIVGKSLKYGEYLPTEFQALIIQDASRGLNVN